MFNYGNCLTVFCFKNYRSCSWVGYVSLIIAIPQFKIEKVILKWRLRLKKGVGEPSPYSSYFSLTRFQLRFIHISGTVTDYVTIFESQRSLSKDVSG